MMKTTKNLFMALTNDLPEKPRYDSSINFPLLPGVLLRVLTANKNSWIAISPEDATLGPKPIYARLTNDGHLEMAVGLFGNKAAPENEQAEPLRLFSPAEMLIFWSLLRHYVDNSINIENGVSAEEVPKLIISKEGEAGKRVIASIRGNNIPENRQIYFAYRSDTSLDNREKLKKAVEEATKILKIFIAELSKANEELMPALDIPLKPLRAATLSKSSSIGDPPTRVAAQAVLSASVEPPGVTQPVRIPSIQALLHRAAEKEAAAQLQAGPPQAPSPIVPPLTPAAGTTRPRRRMPPPLPPNRPSQPGTRPSSIPPPTRGSETRLRTGLSADEVDFSEVGAEAGLAPAKKVR